MRPATKPGHCCRGGLWLTWLTMADQDLTLSIDVGTGSVRAALVDDSGRICAIAAEEQTQIVPAFGWAEQSVEGWWSGVVHAIARVLAGEPDAARRISAVCA